jgi:hypothetical protein
VVRVSLEAKVEVTEALLCTLKVVVVIKGQERLFAPAKQHGLLFPRIVHFAELLRQREEKIELLLRNGGAVRRVVWLGIAAGAWGHRGAQRCR